MPSRKLCLMSELPGLGLLHEFTVDGRPICVANDGGRFAAVNGLCPHRGAPLAEGSLQDGQLLCPWHAWEFDLVTGREGGGCEPVDVYPVQMEGDEVFVLLP